MKRQTGFTIVELLIVIVVIAILAAITIVAYNGIQNRANNSAVITDIRNMNTKVMEAKVLNSGVPPTADQAGLAGVISPSKDAYTVRGNDSVVYCRSDKDFGFIVISKAGQAYMSKNGSPASEVSNWGGSNTSNACQSNTVIKMYINADNPTSIALLTNNAWVGWL